MLSKSNNNYSGADKSLARPGRKQANVSVRMASIYFGALPCREKNLITAGVAMLLKSRASLTCFRACFLPGRAKDLSAPRYYAQEYFSHNLLNVKTRISVPQTFVSDKDTLASLVLAFSHPSKIEHVPNIKT